VDLAVLFGVCLLVSGVAIRVGIALAGYLGIMDHPGGHKQHQASTPFVGGFGLMTVVVSASLLADTFFADVTLGPLSGILFGALAIFLTGLVDDIWRLGFKPRFIVQALVGLSMVFLGGVELRSLGELVPGVVVDLGWLAIPLTVFATIGLINAVNMMDGIDGLSGTGSLVSLALTGIVAYYGNGSAYVFPIVALMGGVAGFLYYNLRYPGNRRARVFLGDNGSMLLGFLFAWLFIAMSQGEQAAMTPVTALWLLALPLMDTVGVMLRRVWFGGSPFRADRNHLHHLFVRAGFRVSDVVLLEAVMQVLFGLIGVCGFLLGVPEYLMFWLFLGVFAVYFVVILRPSSLVTRLRQLNRWLGLPSVQVRGIFVGYLRREKSPEIVAVISQGLGRTYDFQLGVYEMDRSSTDGRNVYCVVHIHTDGDEQLIGNIQRDARRIKRRIAGQQGLEVRLFMGRSSPNSRVGAGEPLLPGSSREADRRGVRSTLIYSMESGCCPVESTVPGFEVSVPPSCR
jgi:UDP-GlcNAc:undecaprenyl-phosphate GlcNAc-1-phosphate transferase